MLEHNYWALRQQAEVLCSQSAAVIVQAHALRAASRAWRQRRVVRAGQHGVVTYCAALQERTTSPRGR
jgi:hypothetical protein